jgi:hypothetical protein
MGVADLQADIYIGGGRLAGAEYIAREGRKQVESDLLISFLFLLFIGEV